MGDRLRRGQAGRGGQPDQVGRSCRHAEIHAAGAVRRSVRVRGDVYSLGVTLYELLARRPAFPDATPQHLIHLITQETLTPLRRLNPEIPADLETIVLKAAVRDPGHRYQTPAELADDLRRFLSDRPILARRTGPVELAWRWCRRNPALAGVTATAFLLMVAITVVSVVASVKTAAANREAAAALDSETAQREYAEQASTLALDALNRIYDRFAPTRLVVIPQAANEAGVEPPPPALPPEAVPLLEDLLRTYEQLARTAGEFPGCIRRRRKPTTASATSAGGSAGWTTPSPPTGPPSTCTPGCPPTRPRTRFPSSWARLQRTRPNAARIAAVRRSSAHAPARRWNPD